LIEDDLIHRAGITVGLINDIPSCGELVPRMVKEAENIIQGVAATFSIDGGEEAWDKVAGRESKL
jgi:hypothetical protein